MAHPATSILSIVLTASLSAFESTPAPTHSSPINMTPISSFTNTTNTTMTTITNVTMKESDTNSSYSPSTKDQHPTPMVTHDFQMTQRTSSFPTTPKPTTPVKITKSKATVKDNGPVAVTTTKPPNQGGDSVGIIILIVIIIVAILAGVVCYVVRNRERRYSVDLRSRPDETQIPLSTVEADANVGIASFNGLQFEGTESSTNEPEKEPEGDITLKAEPEKAAVDVSADCACPSADSSVDQPKLDVPEQSSPAPVEPSTEEKTDDEGAVSNKTSLESLKEANENNSNSTLLYQGGAGVKICGTFWDVCLDL